MAASMASGPVSINLRNPKLRQGWADKIFNCFDADANGCPDQSIQDPIMVVSLTPWLLTIRYMDENEFMNMMGKCGDLTKGMSRQESVS